jgi:hypothetical protein
MGAGGRRVQQFWTTLAASAGRWWWWVVVMGLAVLAALVLGVAVSEVVASELRTHIEQLGEELENAPSRLQVHPVVI